MKKLFTFIVLGICSTGMDAQNVGVNTTNPQASLDVRGSHRVGGINNYMKYDSATGRIEWIGAALYTPVPQQIIRHSNSSEGLYAGGGRLEYRNMTGPVFYSDWTNGNGYFKNNLGIGNPNPQFPLTFSGGIGDQIVFYGVPLYNYGIGLQAGTLQLHSEGPGADIVFGVGSSINFTERMRIKGNGNVGIGNDPAYPLDVSGRMRLRSGGNNNISAGMWMNNNSNVEAAFVGMEDDTHVGFYGNNGAGWNFTMNTQTGALQVNGTDGNAGQVIRSNGAGAAPSWASSTNALYNNTILIEDSTPFTLPQNTTRTLISGMSYTFGLTGNAKVFVSYSFPVQQDLCTSCGVSRVYTEFSVDGSLSRPIRVDLVNGQYTNIASSKIFTLGAGSHTISILGAVLGPGVTFAPCCSFEKVMNIQIIPQ